MAYLFNLVYVLLLLFAAPWLIYQSLRRGKYRAGFAQKLLGLVPRRAANKPCIWFHAVSVGEVNLLAVMLRQLRDRHPDWDCVLSTTTATGHALAKQKYPDLTVFYAPLDFSWAVNTAIGRIRPSLLVLAELELWPNLITAAKRSGANIAIVNGRLSERSFRGYSRMPWLVARLLKQLDCIAVQSDDYAQRFLALGANPDSVHVTGSLKFDGAQTNRDNPATQHLRQLANIAEDEVVFLAGSTQAPEEALAIETFRALSADHPRLRLILVPRHPHRFDEVAEVLKRSGLEWCRRSELGAGVEDRGSGIEQGKTGNGKSETGNEAAEFTSHSSLLTPHSSILLVDTIGELGAWWGTAAIGFVGGSLSTRGGQNMIEPSAYGVAVSFGPNTQNFRDVVQALLARDAAVVVRDQAELTAFVRRCLEQSGFATDMAQRAVSLVEAQRGATERTWSLLDQLMLANRPSKISRAA